VEGQAVSMAALFRALNDRFDKDRFQVHNMGVVGLHCKPGRLREALRIAGEMRHRSTSGECYTEQVLYRDPAR
jgi:hypothetical protein